MSLSIGRNRLNKKTTFWAYNLAPNEVGGNKKLPEANELFETFQLEF